MNHAKASKIAPESEYCLCIINNSPVLYSFIDVAGVEAGDYAVAHTRSGFVVVKVVTKILTDPQKDAAFDFVFQKINIDLWKKLPNIEN